MINHVQFPGLGLEFTIDRVAFRIGDFAVYWYGICIAVGMALALLYAFQKCRDFGIDDNRFIDVIFICTVCAIICARLFYVAFAPIQYESFWDIIDLRDGGIAIYGAVLGVCISGYFACKWRKVPVLPAFDITAIGFLIGQAVGRWGNFFNQEAFGINSNGVLRMYSEGTQSYLSAVQSTLAATGVMVDPAAAVHPTFLYESLWCLLGFILLVCYAKHRKFNGEIALMYVMWYGTERAIVESLRTDALKTAFGLRISQVLAIASVLIAFCVWVALRKKYRGQPLIVTYLARAQGADGPTAVFLSWPAKEKAPSAKEIAQRVDTMVAEVERKARVLPVGVWHQAGVTNAPAQTVARTQATPNGVQPVGVFHTTHL